MKSKPSAADADRTKAGQALERAAARARQLAEQTGTPLYVFKDGRVVDLNRQSTGSYVLREGHPRKMTEVSTPTFGCQSMITPSSCGKWPTTAADSSPLIG